MNVNENRAGLFVQIGILVVGMWGIYSTIVGGQIRTESRLTRIETLVSTQHDELQFQINALDGRVRRIEDRSSYRR